MFVLMFGLMGVASLLPAGSSELGAANQMDRASAIGRAAFRDLKVRGWLNPARWIQPVAGGAGLPAPTTWLPVVIDPLGVAGEFTERFPHPRDPVSMSLNLQDPPVWIYRVPRLTPSKNANAMRAALNTVGSLADEVFRNADELTFAANAKKDRPPLQQFMAANSKRASEGNYTWLATVVPDPSLASLGVNRYTVSVAVVYKRQLQPPPDRALPRLERVVDLDFLDGAEVRLSTNAFAPGVEQLNVRRGQWILVGSALYPGNNADRAIPRYLKWYRVLSASEPVQSAPGMPWMRDVTLAGPDFPERATKPTDPPLPPPYPAGSKIVTGAVLIDGVVAVFEKSLPLEGVGQ